ncbi:hypothetical protein HMPREF1051_2083 [Neisseria sicca VK64]|uniref:Uncharacterized protein n=1 Tax=Neisseria sicca VK64 TaxID=1095748 RepID=I2NW69_NEISI|nr:hypothetical protein HMPREF1051_2083 [Neisseria sicca VK64]
MVGLDSSDYNNIGIRIGKRSSENDASAAFKQISQAASNHFDVFRRPFF